MSKRIRHQKILQVLKQHRVTNQESLKDLLHADGTDVTQATLSRDMRELRLVKVTGADGVPHYSSPDEWESTPTLASLLPTLFQSAEGVEHLLVVKTLKGAAQTVAAGIVWGKGVAGGFGHASRRRYDIGCRERPIRHICS
ncbi:MAG: hypothetical protein CM1200mP14_20750 [Gammaproteobacteria bacterium]|nr:MAG: hypothetical protein CM1200mP14_20750 [Gammaproteobacteria bacterium]